MNAPLGTCPRCGIRRAIKPERGEPYGCRDCPPEKPWDEPVSEDDVAVRWVRDGLVWRAEPVQNALETRGLVRNVWDNRDEPARCANTRRALTAQLTRANRGDEG